MIEVPHEGAALPQIGNGPAGQELLIQMRRLVANLAESGFNVIVDEVGEAEVIADYRARLGPACPAVKVDAPLSELERRERERGDRLLGLAREQSTRLHTGIDYDLEVDTHADTPDALARKVLSAALA